MHLICIGLNNTTAPLELRENLAISEENARFAMAKMGCGDQFQQIHEMVILSTCHRLEFYLVSSQLDFQQIELFISESTGVPLENFYPSLYRFVDDEVVDHLYRVACGLDSVVVGEPQILGQVTRSIELALECGSCGAVLSNLFRSAIYTGKRARTETTISRNPASVSSLAAAIAARQIEDLPGSQVLVIGAGEMAELAVEALRKRGVIKITVINRTFPKAQELARRWKANALTYEQLGESLKEADIVISSTSAPHIIISLSFMENIMQQRLHRPLLMIDIALPRDIDPSIGRLPDVHLYNLDTLNEQVAQVLVNRDAEVPVVEDIILEEKSKFLQYMKTLDMLPIIADLRKQAEFIRTRELKRSFQHLPDLNEMERKRIDALTRALVKKILDSPTRRLRAEADCPHATQFATVARILFDLQENNDLCAFSKEKCTIEVDNSCPGRQE